jgi:hypothetical protein
MHGGNEKPLQYFCRNHEGNDELVYLGIYLRIILKCVLRTGGGGVVRIGTKGKNLVP